MCLTAFVCTCVDVVFHVAAAAGVVVFAAVAVVVCFLLVRLGIMFRLILFWFLCEDCFIVDGLVYLFRSCIFSLLVFALKLKNQMI